MIFEFLSRTQVKNKSNNKGKRILISIGIVCLFVAMIIDFAIGNKSAWWFVIPLIYMISLRSQVSRKKLILDVPVTVVINTEFMSVKFSNTIRSKRGVYSEKYIFDFKTIEKCIFLNKFNELQVLANCKYEVYKDEAVESAISGKKKICILIPESKKPEILEEINKHVNIEYM